jgi:hypothetical protein
MAPVLLLSLALAGCAGSASGTGGPIAASTASSSPSGSTTAGVPARASASACRPVLVLPFECGTYRSVFGVKSVTGSTGGPATDRLTLSFLPVKGRLMLEAVGDDCFNAELPVSVRGARLIRTGEIRYGGGACHGPGANTHDWAYAFLNGPLQFDASGGGGLVFDSRTAMVTFEYDGVTPLGQKPIPRNEFTCVAAHIAPFSCGRYTSTSGTGALAFLRHHQYRLGFEHINGELTVTMKGTCNALSSILEVDGASAVALPGASSSMACAGPDGGWDDTLARFFDGVLTYRIDGSELTFSSRTATAVFQHR